MPADTDEATPPRRAGGPDPAAPRAAETLAWLETLQAKAPVGLGFVDRDFRRVRVNEALAGFNGSTVEEQVGRLVPDLVPTFWPRMEPLYRRVLDGESIIDVEVSGGSAADPLETRHWLNSYYPVELAGEIIGIGIVAVEVTEQRRAEQADRRLSAMVESSGDAIFGATSGGVITSWNQAAERLFGWSRAEMIGRSLDVLSTGAGLAAEQHEILAQVRKGETVRLDTTRRRKDGSVVDVHLTGSPVVGADGSVVGLSAIVGDITDRVQYQRLVETSQRRLAEAQRVAQLGSFELDVATDVMDWSAELYRINGLDPGLAPTAVAFTPVIHPESRKAVLAVWADAVASGSVFDMQYRMVRPDAQVRWVDVHAEPEVGEDGRVRRFVGTVRDVTERVRSTHAEEAASKRFEAGFEQAGIGAGILDLEGVPVRVNAAVCALLDRPAEQLVGRSWVGISHPDDAPLGPAVEAEMAAGRDSYAGERRYLRPDGTVVWAYLHITMVRDERGEPEYLLAQLHDIQARKEMEAELTHQALHDTLTGLPNRALLTDRLAHAIDGARLRGSSLAVIFLDLDGFKVVNDSMGHSAGDELLKQAAQRIAIEIRSTDTLARFGGDEFVVVCEDASAADTAAVCERIRVALSRAFRLGGTNVHVTASLGSVLADDDATPESLLADSDAAMYVAKGLGRDQTGTYDHTLRSAASWRIRTVSGLREALSRHEFAVHYQPVVDLASGVMVGAEALLRWNPESGPVSPADFVPLAEETGLIVPIGAWVLAQACDQLALWQRTAPAMSVAVNVSVRQLVGPEFTPYVADVLARSGVDPGQLTLEVTESVFMKDPEYFGAVLADIRALGVQISIDDFGTGFSSLTYLREFPVDHLKIDKAFIDALGVDEQGSSLVAAFLAMAAALDLGVTAEGIETMAQLSTLNRMRCQRGQGYFLARPLTEAAMAALVLESRHWQIDD